MNPTFERKREILVSEQHFVTSVRTPEVFVSIRVCISLYFQGKSSCARNIAHLLKFEFLLVGNYSHVVG